MRNDMKKIIVFIFAVVALLMGQPSAIAQPDKKPLYDAPFGVQGYTFRKSFPNGVAAGSGRFQ
jgi:hypothetical protein